MSRQAVVSGVEKGGLGHGDLVNRCAACMTVVDSVCLIAACAASSAYELGQLAVWLVEHCVGQPWTLGAVMQ